MRCGETRHRDLFLVLGSSRRFNEPCLVCRETMVTWKVDKTVPDKELFDRGYKHCSNCKEIKPLEEFSNSKNSKDGKQGWCKLCMVSRRQQWKKDNPERNKELQNNYVQKEDVRFTRKIYKRERKDAENKTPKEIRLTAKQWREILNLYGHKCLCCGSTEDITKDHVIPLALGGLTTKDNIQPLCRKCNSRKNDDIIDYRPEFLLLSLD